MPSNAVAATSSSMMIGSFDRLPLVHTRGAPTSATNIACRWVAGSMSPRSRVAGATAGATLLGRARARTIGAAGDCSAARETSSSSTS